MYFDPMFQHVSELFLHRGIWNMEVLNELFPASIVTRIVALPLSSNVHIDRWIWGADKRGFFSVKSTYHVARAQVLNEVSNVPNPSASLWKVIWSTQVPGSVNCVLGKLVPIFFLPVVDLVNVGLISIHNAHYVIMKLKHQCMHFGIAWLRLKLSLLHN